MISVVEVCRFHADQPAALADINYLKPHARLSGLHITQMSSKWVPWSSGDFSALLYFENFLQKTDSIKLALQPSQNQWPLKKSTLVTTAMNCEGIK